MLRRALVPLALVLSLGLAPDAVAATADPPAAHKKKKSSSSSKKDKGESKPATKSSGKSSSSTRSSSKPASKPAARPSHATRPAARPVQRSSSSGSAARPATARPSTARPSTARPSATSRPSTTARPATRSSTVGTAPRTSPETVRRAPVARPGTATRTAPGTAARPSTAAPARADTVRTLPGAPTTRGTVERGVTPRASTPTLRRTNPDAGTGTIGRAGLSERPDMVVPGARTGPDERFRAPLTEPHRLKQRPDDAIPRGFPRQGAETDHPDADAGRDAPSSARHDDHRTARPHPRHVRTRHPDAPYPRPGWHGYWGCYGGWWVHPYWRYTHGTWAVVWFPWAVDPWSPYWMPPVRGGWTWMPGGWVGGVWWPGYYTPTTTIYIDQGVNYVYVPGWWEGEAYVEGYWRRAQRDDGDWIWVDGYYLEDGTHVRGHWMPAEPGPEGYVWEAGFWDGEIWVSGFWRPQYRRGYRWIASYYDTSGVFVGGYWEPVADKPGSVWIPGWFDGNGWNDGYWVTEREYQQADPDAWQPAEGWDAGREESAVEAVPPPVLEDDAPLAVPIQPGG